MDPDFIDVDSDDLSLLKHLAESLDNWIKLHETTRVDLNVALFYLCRELFIVQSPLSVKDKCKEIDGFCFYLKKAAKARKNNKEVVKSN